STSRSGRDTGSGRKSTASTTAKSAVLKPMPMASEATATAVNAGLLTSQRSAKRTSARKDSSTIICAEEETIMIRRSAVSLVLACIAFAGHAATTLTPEQVLSYPFPDELMASPAGSTVAWTFNERGVRNIYAADGPEFKARRITPYKDD